MKNYIIVLMLAIAAGGSANCQSIKVPDGIKAGCWMLEAGCWMLDDRCWMIDAR